MRTIEAQADDEQNAAAKGHILTFLSATQRRQMLHHATVLNVWADLHDEYDDWLRAQRPELERQYQAFAPGSSETLAAACARFDALCLEMSEAQRAPISAESATRKC
jgi:hypothetical protein